MTAQNETVMFIGDTHGDLKHLQWVLDLAERLEVNHMVQVGDFGYWEHPPRKSGPHPALGRWQS
jgi:predicted phosphodiesterase